MMRMLFVLLLAVSSTAYGADEKILVPVMFVGQGAGVHWSAALAVLNRTAKDFRSAGTKYWTTCPIPEGCLLDFVPAGNIGFLGNINSRGGVLLTVPTEDVANIVFRLNIAASPRSPLYEGTDLPVVRERDFRTSTIVLPYVYLGNHTGFRPTRARLRVYDPDAHEGAAVRVSLRRWDLVSPQTSLEATQMFLLRTPAIEQPGSGPAAPLPTYTEFDLDAAFPSSIAAGMLYNVEVEPVTPNLRRWAFITITNNTTNEVTAITPR